MIATADDHRWMARALELAERGLFTTTPNPRVGCVIVRDGECVGEGWHVRAGEPHAEVHALAMAGEADYLVTGDHRAGLLQRGSIGRTRIVTPATFCAEVL